MAALAALCDQAQDVVRSIRVVIEVDIAFA